MKYYKNLSIDESNFSVQRQGCRIHLTTTEYQLFITLLDHSGHICSRNFLLASAFKRQKSNVSPHYHDTRTLLRKYRDVMWNLEVSDLDLQEEFKAEYGLSTDALFVDSEVNKGGNRLESYARALERSKKMMQIIDTAIDLMRRKHKKGEFYYWILYYAYLSPQQCENAGAILQLLETKGISISLRTYYVHRDEAIEVLSSILWGYTSQDCEKITNLLTPD